MNLIDIDQLQTLVAIVDSGSFTRAAEVVHKTQSAVSMQIRRLEERIGRPLFEKEGRGVRLTEDGARLVDYARRIVKLNVEAITVFSAPMLSGRVRLGVPDDYAERYLPLVLARFSASQPRIEVTVVCEPSHLLVNCLKEGGLDLAIITHCADYPVSQIIRQERLLFVSSAKSDVHAEPVVPLALGRPTCMWRSTALEALREAGRQSRVLYSSWNSSAVVAAVLAGLAVGVLPESALREGMRVLGAAEGFPTLPPIRIGLLRNPATKGAIPDALAEHVIAGLDNLTLADDPLSLPAAMAAE